MILTLGGLSRTRAERVIATMRLALASSALFAVWLDPAEPGRYTAVTYGLYAAYLAYSLCLAAVMWSRDSQGRLPLATHLADIAVASVFQYLTLGPSSPFFTYFVFALFSAALRWGWQGTLRTAVVVLGAFVVIAMSLNRTLTPVEFELSRFIIRGVYLVVVAVILVYLGQHEQRLREEIRQLARWPLATSHDPAEAVPPLLAHAAGIVSAGRATLVWSKDDEPWLYIASCPSTQRPLVRVAPDVVFPVVPEALDEATFFSTKPFSAKGSVAVSRGGSLTTWRGQAVHSALEERILGAAGVASTPFRTDRVSGRVFFADVHDPGTESLPLVEVVGREVAASLEQLYAYERARTLAVAEDRIGLARDLHDGVLQSLTGIRLELQELAAPTENTESAPVAPDRLLRLERALAREQRELRLFITDLKPAPPLPACASVADRLDEIRRRVAREWRARVAVRVSPELRLPAPLDHAVPLMMHEAVVNALKHGHPTQVSVDVRSTDGVLRLIVADDGRGFPFAGRRDHVALEASNTGPVSLRERVVAMGGRLEIESTIAGSRVEVSVPLGVTGA
jgi:signal transduction histidine kinase